jgi:hypothetical protein
MAVSQDAMTDDSVAGLAGWTTLMSRWNSMLTAPALEWRIDLARRPAVGVRRDGRPIGALILAIGTLWLAVPMPALLGGAPFPIAELGRSGAWASLGIGVALMLWGLWVLWCRQTIRIHGDEVHVRTRHLLGVTSWSEPLASYRAVVWRSEPIHRRAGRRTLHLVELSHADRARTVTLLSSTGEVGARDCWWAWAQDLGLPAIRLHAGEQEVVAREAAKPVPSAQ